MVSTQHQRCSKVPNIQEVRMRKRQRASGCISKTFLDRNSSGLVPLLFLIFCLPSLGSAEPVIPILLNSAKVGNTTGAQRGIFKNFSHNDITETDIGTGGQKIYELTVPEQNMHTNLEISTCSGSNFDTYIALLSKNPTTETNAIVISESANDIICQTGRTKAFLSTKVTNGTYYIIVTGNGQEEGLFNLSVRGQKATPTPVPWGLDRIDQRNLPLNKEYSVDDSGEGVWIYIIDSGVRISHEEFEGRAIAGYDFVNSKQDSAVDCTGHGTHVAGTIAGKNFGVAKKSKLVAIRVFGCDNKAKSSAIIDAVGWVLVDSKIKSRTNVIVTLMFSTSSTESSILGSTIRGIIRTGIPVVVPAGNNAANACNYYLGSLEKLLTVGSTDTSDDRSLFSNSGNCTDIYAPGSSVESSWHTSDTAWRKMGGTAQAAAHVVGVVGNLMAINSGIKAAMVRNVIASISTKDLVGKVAANASTRFAFVRSVPKFTGQPPSKPNVYLFTILRIETSRCEVNSESVIAIQKKCADLLSISDSQVRATCITNDSEGPTPDSKKLEVRIEIPERMAAASFTILEEALGPGKDRIEESLGFTFTVIEQPWAVDSTPIVFWGAPSFSETDSLSLSTGAIAGAVVGAICILAILVALLWIAYRSATKLDEVESMEGSADFERGPVHFDDFSGPDGGETIPRSFRNIVKGLNFRRSGSARNSSFIHGGAERGMNKMGSFIGGPNSAVAKDMVRMESFGGEAFAGLDSFSRSTSMAGSEPGSRSSGSMSSDLPLSFRGINNTVLNNVSSRRRLGSSDSRSSLTDESMRMQSLGGEAFAMIGQQMSMAFGSSESQRNVGTPREPEGGTTRTQESTREEASTDTSQLPTEPSFFDG